MIHRLQGKISRQGHLINTSNLQIQDLLKKDFPDIDVNEKSYSGVKVTLYGQSITFYRKAKKYHIESLNKWVNMVNEHFELTAYEVCKNHFINVKSPVFELKTFEKTDSGVQACIDHIKQKLEVFNAANPGKEHNKTVLFVETIISELYQFL